VNAITVVEDEVRELVRRHASWPPGVRRGGRVRSAAEVPRRLTVEEIWINEPTKVFISRRGVHELTTTIVTGDEVRDLCEKMLKSSGRRVDLATPFVEPNPRLG